MVALRAMLSVVDAGGQAALLAPAEVLAQQHYAAPSPRCWGRWRKRASSVGRTTRRAWCCSPVRRARRAAVRRCWLPRRARPASSWEPTLSCRIPCSSPDLGLIVVDEQHRFEVEQRDALRAKADRPPHLLVMTATPIPRTVAMTVFGDLDVSTLTELPRGRKPIATHVVPVDEKPHYLERAWARVREEAAGGHGVYVVCPRIGDGAEPDGDLSLRPTPTMTGVRHWQFWTWRRCCPRGRLAGCVSRCCTAAWRRRPGRGHASIRCRRGGRLVATTVVEVGVDVPTATTVVMDADRFGVSQLHQLRGRVGRGTAAGICLLVTDMPAGSPARERLEAVAASQDGFELSRVDLEQRREDVLGASQSGRRSSLRLLGVIRDEDIIRAARDRPPRSWTPTELARAPALRRELEALLEAGRRATWRSPRACASWRQRRRSTDRHPRTRYPTNVGPDPRSPVLDAHGNARGPLAGARVLDLYAGSGAVGLEALSRGAATRCSWNRTARWSVCYAATSTSSASTARRSPRCLSSVSPPSRRRPLRTRPVPHRLPRPSVLAVHGQPGHGPPRSAS